MNDRLGEWQYPAYRSFTENLRDETGQLHHKNDAIVADP
jgi:hypothetical protein